MVIWRYLFFQAFKNIFATLIFILSLYFVLTYMDENQHYFPRYHISGHTIFLYYIWQLPIISFLLLPFAVLIGSIITNWLLAKHGEISALRSAGMSMLKISYPLIFVGIFYAALQFYLSEIIIPHASKQYLDIKNNLIEKNSSFSAFTESKWLKNSHSILHYTVYDKTKKILQKPELLLFDNNGFAKAIIHAQYANFDLMHKSWLLHNVIVTQFVANKITKKKSSKLFFTDIDFLPPKMLKQGADSNQLSYWTLKSLVHAASKAGANVINSQVDLQFKLSQPIANVLFIFLTLAFAVPKERQEENYIGILICLIAALIYWFGNMALRNFAIKGILPPLLAAWLMNLLIASLSFFLVKKLDRGQ